MSQGPTKTAEDRARDERADILAGIRGDPKARALRASDLDGPIMDMVRAVIIAELNKRGL